MKQNKSSFKWRHFEPSIVLLCVRWYCRYQLSYRDLEEMIRERGLSVDHVTIFRWVQRLAPCIDGTLVYSSELSILTVILYQQPGYDPLGKLDRREEL